MNARFVSCVGVAFALSTSPAAASDHADGSSTLDSTPAADLHDLYAWTDDGRLNLVLTVAGPVSDDIQYVFHIGRAGSSMAAATGPAQSQTEIICVPEVEGTNTTCWVGNPLEGGDFVSGDATLDSGVPSQSGRTRVHVGRHADPFYWYAAGFSSVVASTQDIVAAIDADDYPENFDNIDTGPAALGPGCAGGMFDTIAEVLVLLLAGDLTWGPSGGGSCSSRSPSAAFNEFDGADVDAIVVEVDTALLDGTGDYFQVWASTHQG